MADLYDTTREAQRDRMAFWLDTVCQQILPVQIDPRHDAVPRAAMACAQLGSLRVRDVVGGNHVYVRDAADIRRGDPDTFQIGIPLGGSSMLAQDGREAILHGGDMVLYDSARPFSLVMQNRFHWQVFLLPKSKLRRSEAELRELTAVGMNGSCGVASVVSRFLRGIAADAEALEKDPSAGALGENAADLIGTLVRAQFGKPWDVSDPAAVLRKRICAFIEDAHDDPALDPSMIAAAHGLSVRKLHQLFEGSGLTVMDWLRTVRLEAIRRDLADARLADWPVGRIAVVHGLPNQAIFTRMFRTAFGCTPREYRCKSL